MILAENQFVIRAILFFTPLLHHPSLLCSQLALTLCLNKLSDKVPRHADAEVQIIKCHMVSYELTEIVKAD